MPSSSIVTQFTNGYIINNYCHDTVREEIIFGKKNNRRIFVFKKDFFPEFLCSIVTQFANGYTRNTSARRFYFVFFFFFSLSVLQVCAVVAVTDLVREKKRQKKI